VKWLPQSLGARLLWAFVAAAATIAGLAFAVRERDAVRAAERRAVPLPPPPPALGVTLAPTQGRVLLASRIEAVAPDVAPVVQVLPNGTAVLRRPAPLALSPLASASDSDAALLLPGRSLAQLEPAVRAAVLDLIGQLVPMRPVPPERLRLVDVEPAGGDLAPLLQWVP
jgi:hypothetical protein